MKKVCFVTTVSSTLDVFFVDSARYLHEHEGHEIVLMCSENAEFASTLPECLRFVPVPMERGIRVAGIRAIIRMVRVFRCERFDLVQYATPNASLYASIAARVAGIPVRLYCQCGIRYVSETGLLRRVLKSMEWLTCSLSSHVRVASHGNMELGTREALYKAEKAYVLGEGGTVGVDTGEYRLDYKPYQREEVRREIGLGESFVFGFVARISQDKGIIELLEAIRILSATADVKLLCVGDDEMPNDVGSTRDLHVWAQSAECVVFAGKVPKGEVRRYYAAMDCFVLPSHREGFGMALQEAGAMALPIITTDIPGAGEVMEEGVSCMLVPARDAHALQEAMAAVMSDGALRQRLGEGARRRVETYFGRSDMLARQCEDYSRLMQ